MLHQTQLIPFASAFPSPSPHRRRPMQLSPMDKALRHPDAAAADRFEADAAVWTAVADLGEGFSVEELLDLGEFAEDPEPETKPAALLNLEDADRKTSPSDAPLSLAAPEIDLPAHDAEELEWVSRVMDDDSLPVPPPPPAALAAAPPLPTKRSRTYAFCALSTDAALVPVKAKRSKRVRGGGGSVWSLSGYGGAISDSSSSTTMTGTLVATASSSSSSSGTVSPFLFYDSSTLLQNPRKPKLKASGRPPKKRGRKPKNPPTAEHSQDSGGEGDGRRCTHCGVSKTPQWRAGPEGPKTLCNACGVRYKSGRLLPEYRPACSPTFVGSIHSNSHRKVLELRRKKEALDEAAPPFLSQLSFARLGPRAVAAHP